MSNVQGSKLGGKLFLCMIGVMLIGVGSVFGWVMIRSYLNAKATREWPQVEAVVLRTEIAERQIKGSPPEYCFKILYGYHFQGEELTSERLAPRGSKWTKKQTLAAELVAEYPPGSTHTAWVNPDRKSFAILEHDTKAAGYTLWFPALFVLAGGGMIWGALRKSDGV